MAGAIIFNCPKVTQLQKVAPTRIDTKIRQIHLGSDTINEDCMKPSGKMKD